MNKIKVKFYVENNRLGSGVGDIEEVVVIDLDGIETHRIGFEIEDCFNDWLFKNMSWGWDVIEEGDG